jgi:hypothetical protein
VQPAELSETVQSAVQLVDRLAVVIAGGFMVARFAEDFGTDFQYGDEGVDGWEVLAERLLGFFHGGVGGVESFFEVASVPQRLDTFAEDGDEGGGG